LSGISADAPVMDANGQANHPIYKAAHNAATHQSGNITAAFVDSNGNILPSTTGASHVSIYVLKDGKALEINSPPLPK